MSTYWLDATDFNRGGWQLDTQFVREMGTSYLIACDIPGERVKDAEAVFSAENDGFYRIYVHTHNWKTEYSPGKFNIGVDDEILPSVMGAKPNSKWYWDIAGDIFLKKGEHKLKLKDLTGWLARVSAVVITDDREFFPAGDEKRFLKQRSEIKGINTKILDRGTWDLVVVGAGSGGVPTAVAAARKGLKVALITDRPVVGGNASDESYVSFSGAGSHNEGSQETGIANEIKCLHYKFDLTWQGAMEKLIENEKNITLFTDTLCTDAETDNGKITSIECTDTLTLEKSRYYAPVFADCTGDCWLAYYAGAKYRIGRESYREYFEDSAPESGDIMTMSGCLKGLIGKTEITGYLAEDTGEKQEFVLPEFCRKLPEELYRDCGRVYTADWWLENTNDFDDLFDGEYTRDELICLTLGYFDWLKNSEKTKKQAENYKLTELSVFNAKRENRRVLGDYVLKFGDLKNSVKFEDGVAYCGWNVDVHNIKGMFSGKEGPFDLDEHIKPSQIPYRCLYSKNINNLFVASRGISVTHIALGSTRVQSTIATVGQAVGTAAAYCKKYGILPREVGEKHIKELQQQLLLDDQTLTGVFNEDERDLARTSRVWASDTAKEEIIACTKNFTVCPSAENVIKGYFRDEKVSQGWYSHIGLPQSLVFELDRKSEISAIQVTTDTDLYNPLWSFRDMPVFGKTATKIKYEVFGENGWVRVGETENNFLRVMRITFPTVTADKVRITVEDSNDGKSAKIFEVRIYGQPDVFEEIIG